MVPSVSKKATGVGLLGLGVVGSAVASAITERYSVRGADVPISIEAVVVRDTSRKRSVELESSIISTDPDTVVSNSSIGLVIELMGGENPAYDYISNSLKAGKHVVTANKEVMCKRGRELLAIADENEVQLLYEASVGGGIPIIGPLMNDLTANRIQSI